MKNARPYKFSQSVVEAMSCVCNLDAHKPAKCPERGPRPAYPSDRADYVPPNRR